MTARPTIAFALGAVMTAALGACALPWIGPDPAARLWAAAGFASMALPGIVCGAWMAHAHGGRGTRFLAALATGFVLRVLAAAVGTFAVARVDGGLAGAWIGGLAAGFVPLLAFEIVWFSRRLPVPTAGARGRA